MQKKFLKHLKKGLKKINRKSGIKHASEKHGEHKHETHTHNESPLRKQEHYHIKHHQMHHENKVKHRTENKVEHKTENKVKHHKIHNLRKVHHAAHHISKTKPLILPTGKDERNQDMRSKKDKKRLAHEAQQKRNLKNVPTLQLRDEKEIAMDFAAKVYQKFNKMIKSVVLFGSAAKQSNVSGSDIDIIILLDDASIRWDQELISWYREELEKLVKANPYPEELHINTIKLTTWWDDLLRGDPVVINIIRDGETLIDFGGFFDPLKYLLVTGKIKATPESVYNLLERAPMHILRSKASEIGAIEGLFWSMVDSSQAALIAIGVQPPSPEHISAELKTRFVDSGKLKIKYVVWYRDLFILHKKIVHREISDLKGVEIDEWQSKAKEFLGIMARLVNDEISG